MPCPKRELCEAFAGRLIEEAEESGHEDGKGKIVATRPGAPFGYVGPRAWLCRLQSSGRKGGSAAKTCGELTP